MNFLGKFHLILGRCAILLQVGPWASGGAGNSQARPNKHRPHPFLTSRALNIDSASLNLMNVCLSQKLLPNFFFCRLKRSEDSVP
jgi:hypothetical protein